MSRATSRASAATSAVKGWTKCGTAAVLEVDSELVTVSTGKTEVLMPTLLQSSPARSLRPLCWRQGQGGAKEPALGDGQLRELQGAWGAQPPASMGARRVGGVLPRLIYLFFKRSWRWGRSLMAGVSQMSAFKKGQNGDPGSNRHCQPHVSPWEVMSSLEAHL